MAPAPAFLPGESRGQRALGAAVHGVAKVRHNFVIESSRLWKCELSAVFFPQLDSSLTVFSSYSSEFEVGGISQVL